MSFFYVSSYFHYKPSFTWTYIRFLLKVKKAQHTFKISLLSSFEQGTSSWKCIPQISKTKKNISALSNGNTGTMITLLFQSGTKSKAERAFLESCDSEDQTSEWGALFISSSVNCVVRLFYKCPRGIVVQHWCTEAPSVLKNYRYLQRTKKKWWNAEKKPGATDTMWSYLSQIDLKSWVLHYLILPEWAGRVLPRSAPSSD